MPSVDILIAALIASGDPDLARSAQNLKELVSGTCPEHQAKVLKEQSYRITAKIHTDWDFSINNSCELKLELYANTRSEAIDKLVNYLNHEADYSLSESPDNESTVNYFKEEYVATLPIALSKTFSIKKSGNWGFEVNLYEPLSLKDGYIFPNSTVTLGGVDYEV